MKTARRGIGTGVVAGIVVVIIIVAVVAYLVLAGGGGNQSSQSSESQTSSSSTTSSNSTSTIQIAGVSIPAGAAGSDQINYFPSRITVVIGINNTVKWTNNDNATHTVTGPLFDSGLLTVHQSFTFAFTSPGNYSYHCSIHSWMSGFVIVKSG